MLWSIILAQVAIDTARIDAVFQRFSGHSPGCALNVVADGRTVYERGYGYASLELDVPITPRSVFDIGSVSKQFTAMSILLLARDGKLSIDDDIRKFIPELPNLGHVTLRELMHHTSGWRDYTDVMSMEGFDERDHTTDQDALDVLTRQRGLNFRPESRWQYSNTGYFVLSIVVKRVSGKSLRDFAAERIFGPLGMHDTQYLDDTRMIVPRRATGYMPADSGGWQVEMSNWDQTGDGAVQTTVEDLAKWDANFSAPTVGDASIIAMMQEPDQADYGFGLWRDEYNHETRVWHTGAWAGYRAALMRFPDRHASIIIECNVADAHTYRLATGVADAILPARAAVPPPPATAPPTNAVGLYSSDAVGDVLRVTTRDHMVIIDVGDQHHTLDSWLGGLWRDPADGSTYEFGRDRVIVRSFEDTPDTMRRVPPPGIVKPADFTGTYRSTEVGVSYTVISNGDHLTLHQRRGPDLALAPLYRDAFMTSEGTPLHFLRDTSGQVNAFSITTGGVHDLRFLRIRSAASLP